MTTLEIDKNKRMLKINNKLYLPRNFISLKGEIEDINENFVIIKNPSLGFYNKNNKINFANLKENSLKLINDKNVPFNGMAKKDKVRIDFLIIKQKILEISNNEKTYKELILKTTIEKD